MRTITEYETAVRKMNTGKPVGMGELSVEMVKANGLVGIKWLARMFNVCITAGDIQAEWQRRVFVLCQIC